VSLETVSGRPYNKDVPGESYGSSGYEGVRCANCGRPPGPAEYPLHDHGWKTPDDGQTRYCPNCVSEMPEPG
jgi:hypothetical protein